MSNTREISWIDIDRQVHAYDFTDYMQKVARARHVVRKVYMIIDECARDRGLASLEHQALIQIFGAAGGELSVGQLAQRLNIVAGLASRLVRRLQDEGLIRSSKSARDRRAMLLSATQAGEQRLFEIGEEAHERVAEFRLSISEEERQAAHEIMAFYVGGALPTGQGPQSRHRSA